MNADQPFFIDRFDAGVKLAAKLGAYAHREGIVVLGLPRGGVPVAFRVAESLDAPLDVFIVRKLGVPGEEELAMGAVASGGLVTVNEDVLLFYGVAREAFEDAVQRETAVIAERERLLRGEPHDGKIEHRIGPVDLPAYWIDEHEVTNAEYARFLRESGWRPRHPENFLKHWGGAIPPREIEDHPVAYVDLDDARAYARWAGKRLPAEPEWHRAAQGDDGRTWPWGNEYDPAKTNGDGKGTAPVTAHPAGRSPFGCLDMAGNVWEWTESERSDGHTRFAIIRGGSYWKARGSIWYVEGGARPITSHAKFILMWPGLDRCATIGFRCVKDIAPAGK